MNQFYKLIFKTMKKLFNILFVFAIVNVVFITSCKESSSEDPAADSEFTILTEYLVSSGMDLDHVLKSAAGDKFVFAPAEASDVSGRYIIDIRSAEHFGEGHIEGAVNTPVSNILTQAENAGDKKILVACYSGQTACFATALLRLYGYEDAQALKWGMSGWNSATDRWTPSIGDSGAGKLVTTAAPENTTYDPPTINTGNSDGASILRARVEAVVAEWGSATVSGDAVASNPANYFVNNYFSTDHYVGFGHIEGAVRVNPLTIENGGVGYLDASKPVVTYCYTGQTSAVITAFLRVLGYDAKSMLFGMNQLNHSNDFWTSGEVANHWGHNASSKDFPIVQ
mgnify:CR=1 FL=1|jgi:rhodanese-related sulfurtransferase